MDSRKFEIIQELMAELQEEMDMDGGDISERLGRGKPEMGAAKIEIEAIPDMDGGEMEDMEYEASPEDKLKDRLMKMRG